MELALPELEPGGEVAELVVVRCVQGVVGAVPGRCHVKLSNCLIVRPVEGDDIQVSIVGTSDDVPLRQSSRVDSNLIEVLVALCCPVQSGSQNKMVRVDSPNGLHNGSEVAD